MLQCPPSVAVRFVVSTDDVVVVRVNAASSEEAEFRRPLLYFLKDSEVALDSALEVLRDAVWLFALVHENLVDVVHLVVLRDANPEVVILAARQASIEATDFLQHVLSNYDCRCRVNTVTF